MKNPFSLPAAARLEPALPAALLCAAVLLSGLRSPGGWLAFSLLFLLWAAVSSRPFSPRANGAAALYLAWLCAAAAFSPWPEATLLPLARCLLPGLFFFAALSCEHGAAWWLKALLALGAAAAATLLGQALAGAPATGFIGLNPNYTAAFAAAALPAALLLAAGEAGRARRLAFALAPLLLAGLVASASRGALLGAALASAAALWAAGRRRALGALALCAAAALLLPHSFWSWLLKLHDPRAFERPQLWLAALRAAADSPLFGWGPGLFGRAFELFKFPYFDGVSYYGHLTPHAHSEPLNLAAEAGLPGMLFFAAAAFTGLRAGFRRNLPLAAAALSALVQGCVDMVFWSGAVALLFWGSLGFAAASEHPAGGRQLRLWLSGLCAALVLGGAAAASGGAAARNRDFSAKIAASSPALELALARRAALAEPYNAFAARAAGTTAAAAGDLAQAEVFLLAAAGLEPGYAGARLDLAKIYSAAGRRSDCLAQAALARQRAPERGMNAYQRGLLALSQEEIKELAANPCAKN